MHMRSEEITKFSFVKGYDRILMMNSKRFLSCNEMVKAIEEQNCDAVQTLLDEGFDVDTELMLHKYPIMICIECNNLGIGEFLISQGCSLSLKDQHGCTPLHLAVQLLNFDFVKLLLHSRADLTSIDEGGRTVLHIAAQMNSLRMVELLMEKANPDVLSIMDKEGKTPFIFACTHGSEALISYFLTKGCDVNTEFGLYKNTPLLSAISNRNCSLEKLSSLLDAGANINHVNKCSETPLLKAFHILGVNNFSGATYALFQNICCLLIDRGSDVNVRNSLGDTPLHFAVSMNNEVLVLKLLNAGSYVNATNKLGLNPMSYACKNGVRRMATLLMNSGAVVNDFLWFSDTNRSVLNYVIQKSKECQQLRDMCRLVIRENLQKSIEKSAPKLPLPVPLITFIQFVE